MAEVDLLVPRRDDIVDRDQTENWDVVEEEEFDEDDEATAAPREAPSDNEGSDDSPPPPQKQPRVDVNIDHEEEEDEGGLAGPAGERADPPKRKKHRRGKARSKKRKWKPYYKLTWTEKQELEDREAIRANRVREERFAHGQPVAPYNTTQFLMEDHNVQEPDLETIANGHRHHRESTSLESSDEFYSSPEDEEEFLQKEFSAVYESIHAERLNSMTKAELIQEYIQLEDRVDKLEQKLKMVEEARSFSPVNSATVTSTRDSEVQVVDEEEQEWRDSDSENLEKIRIFQEEIRVLAEVNERLRIENKNLREKSDSGAGSMEGTDD